MKKKPLRYILILWSSLVLLGGCHNGTSLPQTELTTGAEATPSGVILSPCEDLGQEYLDGFIFFGESTTYHMKSRGVLSGGTETKQVWGPDIGTVNLDTETPSLLIRYPETGELLPFSEAVRRSSPHRILLTFGLNGAARNIQRGSEYYKSCYRSLIDAIRAASPNTEILLQSCFPIAASMDMSRYTVTAKELNGYISTINSWVVQLAAECGLGYLNTAEVLSDGDGFLREEYQVGDGYHLTADAYRVILQYIRTHGRKDIP